MTDLEFQLFFAEEVSRGLLLIVIGFVMVAVWEKIERDYKSGNLKIWKGDKRI